MDSNFEAYYDADLMKRIIAYFSMKERVDQEVIRTVPCLRCVIDAIEIIRVHSGVLVLD